MWSTVHKLFVTQHIYNTFGTSSLYRVSAAVPKPAVAPYYARGTANFSPLATPRMSCHRRNNIPQYMLSESIKL